MKRFERRRLSFEGLVAAPSQVFGAVRIVPLLRETPIEDLRLYSLPTAADLTTVQLDRRTAYTSYIPHAMVAALDDGEPWANLGSRLLPRKAKPRDVFDVKVMQRLSRRIGRGQLRLLPQHMGMDAYLSVGFTGPNVVWPEYTREVLSWGLSPRSEWVSRAFDLRGFADALRVFELCPGQVGSLVFVADAFSTAFITPRPEDYRRLHRTMLEDMVADLLVQYAVLYPETAALWSPIDAASVRSFDDLEQAVGGLRREWNRFAAFMASDLLDADYEMQQLHSMDRYRLMRFRPTFRRQDVNHVGEVILDDQGQLAFLKTARLSAAQSRRGLLLSTLVAVDWDLLTAARAVGNSREEFIARLRKAGLERLLKKSA
ncbi:MAG: hypothetical protein AAF799_29115 [Myxococcota bacterium]